MRLLFIIILIVVVIMGRILAVIKFESKFARFGSLAAILLLVLALCFWDEGTVHNGKIHITERKMKVEFLEADREFTDSMKLGANKSLNIKADCSEGRLLLTVYQRQKESTFDISEWNGSLKLDGFEEGYINLHLNNENARNVSVEITCED